VLGTAPLEGGVKLLKGEGFGEVKLGSANAKKESCELTGEIELKGGLTADGFLKANSGGKFDVSAGVGSGKSSWSAV